MNMTNKEMMNRFTEAFGDTTVELTFRDLTEGMDSYFKLMKRTQHICRLIREESELKKHHRAYLHVRAEIDEAVSDTLNFIFEEMKSLSQKDHIYHVPFHNRNASCAKCGEDTRCCEYAEEVEKNHEAKKFPFAQAESEDEEAIVVIPKEDFDCMVEDLLTMAELIELVTEMRTEDMTAVHEIGKFVPSLAAYERDRLELYRDAQFEAEEIVDRWDDDYEPDEYFSD